MRDSSASPEERPVLRADAALRVVGDELEVDVNEEVYALSGHDPVAIRDALLALNGLCALPAVSARSGVPAATLRRLIADLEATGVVTTLRTGETFVETDTFARVCRTLYVPWKARLFRHPLWSGLVDGTLARPVFVGWAIESYWFIDGVIDRIPLAVAHSEQRGIRAIFAHHFAEEWDHYTFFARTLDELGVDAEQRAVGQPLPATRAVQTCMRAAARKDPLRYAVCSGFLESTGGDRAIARSFFDHVSKHYDSADSPAVRPMADHVALDEAYAHGSLVEKIVHERGALPLGLAQSALQDAFTLVETLEMWSTDIVRHYTAPGALPLSAIRAYRPMENR